ncbi:MAG: AAA family ATPase [Bacillota bacterium]
MKSKLVGVGGGTGAGKTTLCKKVKEKMGDKLCLISLDSYFYEDTDSHNRPESINIDKFLEDLDILLEGNKAVHRGQIYHSSPVILIEGHLTLTFTKLFKRLDLSIFVDQDVEERVLRRLERNMDENCNFESITSWYRNDVKDNHWQFIEPTKAKADLIIWGEVNSRRVQVLTDILNSLI